MRKIPLSLKNFKGKYALVDDCDYDTLSQFNWCLDNKGYAVRRGRKKEGVLFDKLILMHRSILGVFDSSLGIDHVNQDSLDNRRCNLRVCTQSQNNANQKNRVDSVSGFKGVTWVKSLKRWRAMIRINNVLRHLGVFTDKQEAAKAYNRAAVEYFGSFACLNKI